LRIIGIITVERHGERRDKWSIKEKWHTVVNWFEQDGEENGLKRREKIIWTMHSCSLFLPSQFAGKVVITEKIRF
jgi:hypothetical protein